jgi:hypothetical protein
MRGRKAKRLRRLVYTTKKEARADARRYARGSSGGLMTMDWPRRAYQALKRGYVVEQLREKWHGRVASHDVIVRANATGSK